MRLLWPDGHDGADLQAFIDAEVPAGRATYRQLSLVALGTAAARALVNPSLEAMLTEGGSTIDRRREVDAVDQLSGSDWDLALVLSPHKQLARAICTSLAPAAAATGVVDTLLRIGDETVGINTNQFGARTALLMLTAGHVPGRILLVGTGATARSILLGARSAFPEATIGVIGRSREKATAMIGERGDGELVDSPREFAADVVINATTVGESSDDGELPFALRDAIGAGTRYFDVNNRTSALQTSALQVGCMVMGGQYMQTVVNAARALLVNPAKSL